MKQSSKISLVLLGSVSAFTLMGCDKSVPDGTPIFESTAQCEQNGGTDCGKAYAEALNHHVKYAIQYGTEENCKQLHDSCMEVKPTPDQSLWLPSMVGFIVDKGKITDSRPVYIQNPQDGQDRQVVAGPIFGPSYQPIYLGSYYYGGPWGSSTTVVTSSGFRAGTLSQGMATSASRAGVSVSSIGSSAGRVGTVSAAARGGFGASGFGSAGA